tara:strand:- start:1273 stop:2070 length:798 start_codon:yes stop_codon:yes gene_type:complete
MVKICPECKKEFVPKKDKTKRTKKFFCSTKCYQKTYKRNHRKPLRILNCENCNKEIRTRRHWQRYCSKECLNKSEVTANNWKKQNQKRKIIIKIKNCLQCNEEFLPKQNRAKYCSRKCYHKTDDYRQMDKKRLPTRINLKYSEWSEKRKNSKIKYNKRKRETDPIYKLAANMRARVGMFLKLKKFKKTNSTFKLIGCTPQFLKKYLEKQFKPGMTWENHSLKGWHVDHIEPLDRAKNPEDKERLCHYTNLQPLWAIENIKKSNKY